MKKIRLKKSHIAVAVNFHNPFSSCDYNLNRFQYRLERSPAVRGKFITHG